MSRRKNDPSKDRKALETYVTLRGYKQGRDRKSKDQNGLLNLDEIAGIMGISISTLGNYKMEKSMTNKESGNITDKKTKQELAEELNINVKTMRNYVRYAQYLENIEKNIGKEQAEKFNDILDKLYKNKKENISNEQVMQLSKIPPTEQKRVVNLIIKNPQNAKQIINNELPLCKTKITVTLPAFINEWYGYKAMYAGISKSKYIEELLIKFMGVHDSDK